MCPVTNEDVHNAQAIFHPDLASIRGKMACHKPEQIVADYINIPRDFFTHHNRVTLVAYLMFVNLVLFLVSASGNINIIALNMHLNERHPSLAPSGAYHPCLCSCWFYCPNDLNGQ
jgi:hypothetical protein